MNARDALATCARASSGVGARHDDDDVGMAARGDPRLGAGEHPVVAVAHGLACAATTASEPASGSRQRERAEHLAARHRLQESLLLLVGAEAEEHLRGQRVVHAHQHRDRRVGGGDLLEREQVRERVEPEAVVLLGDQHAEEAQLAELRRDAAIEAGFAVPLARRAARARPRRSSRASATDLAAASR